MRTTWRRRSFSTARLRSSHWLLGPRRSSCVPRHSPSDVIASSSLTGSSHAASASSTSSTPSGSSSTSSPPSRAWRATGWSTTAVSQSSRSAARDRDTPAEKDAQSPLCYGPAVKPAWLTRVRAVLEGGPVGEHALLGTAFFLGRWLLHLAGVRLNFDLR